ncbi:MAG: hypothetical protein ACYDC1_25425 [Limisphaerales bacterium]
MSGMRMVCCFGVVVLGLWLTIAPRAQPAAVVMAGLDAGVDGVDAGEVLLSELNCAACHAPASQVVGRLLPNSGPRLGDVASRVRPDFLRAWLRNPSREKPGTPMPDLFHGLAEAEREDTVNDVVHFLRSLAPAARVEPVSLNRIAFEQGRVLYHRIGCVACHPPREPAAVLFPGSTGPKQPDTIRFVMAKLEQTSVPLPNLTAKYPSGALEQFLLDPVTVRPTGRMPSLNLTTNEARAIATYLSHSGPGAAPAVRSEPGVNRTAAKRGRQLFASAGCLACHELDAAGFQELSRLTAKPLAALVADHPDGCLGEAPGKGIPRFQLSPAQRHALRSTIARLSDLDQPVSVARELATRMTAFNCYACHSRDGFGGPSPSRSDYFTSMDGTDPGDEGRFPPHLSGVGAKLVPDWLGQVLTNRGAVRPYMAVRMPQHGVANVGGWVARFVAADARSPVKPLLDVPGQIEVGRTLVGTGGCACISCHRFGAYRSSGLDVMDLTVAAGRLQRDWFRRYLLDPSSLRPGTRMPMFWPDGESMFKEILGGNTERQIDSIWRYLSEGTNAIPPIGIPENASTPVLH